MKGTRNPAETRRSDSDDSLLSSAPDGSRTATSLALVLVWSRDEPERVGEVVLVPRDGRVRVIGRGGVEPDDSVVPWLRQRPGHEDITGPLRSERISRAQLEVEAHEHGLEIANVGRGSMAIDGVEVDRGRAEEGSLVELPRRLLMMCVRRPLVMAGFTIPEGQRPAVFGEADAFGVVGESPAAWEQRRSLAFAAQRNVHVLLTGPSGSGKELAAATIHGLSSRSRRPFVARNAATLPAGLIDAELFGHARNYPNAGMPARPGLVGEADDGTLFLDEIGELPHDAQSHLLRLMDDGEYQRLGETGMRRSRARVIAATNRDPSTLKHDVLARFALRITVEGLETRLEDVPLLARHLLRRMASDDPSLVERFWSPATLEGSPRLSPRLVIMLLRQRYATHARELAEILWRAVLETREGPYLQAPGARAASTSDERGSDEDAAEPEPIGDVDPRDLSEAEVRDAIARAGGVKERAWRLLGLRNRFQLRRLLEKYGLE